LKEREAVNIVFAAAPSQNEFLAALVTLPVDWARINAFHMDEYIGLEEDVSRSFGTYLRERLFEKVSFRSVQYINGRAADALEECERYALLLRQFPTDIVCMGIGENCHIAFNDPPVADFSDPKLVKIVVLDGDCRQQQVNDNCFPSLEEVPKRALTLTVPALLKGRRLFVIVPGERKAMAVYHTLNSPVGEPYPSTILRNHPAVKLFLDKDSCKMIGP
jgi:glucosamine-6-phosphate deaminase